MQTDQISNAQSLAADATSLNRLKFQAGKATPESIKETARQFESLFMRELIKSMREATMKSGMLDSAQGDMATDMMDQQFAVQMSGMPGGLSELIARQLMQQAGLSDAAAKPAANALPVSQLPPSAIPKAAQGFVQEHENAAQQVQRSSGIPASFMLGQAGHESGWGQREIRMPDGSTSHNLFGIKAGGDWRGKVAQITTTEFVDGEARKTVAKFRAYDSYADSFRDYAKLISGSPRYAQAMQQTDSAKDYASSLQSAGYATDPNYADKLSRAINTTLQVQRAAQARGQA